MDAFRAEVQSRFGVLPNFFCTAASAPGLIEQLWGFAKSAYLDNPLPSLFKERLFVQLSRFCAIRYCIVRHVGFLVGEGRPAGDPAAQPESIEQVITLLSRPVPDAQRLKETLAVLESIAAPIAIPESGSELEGRLFDVLMVVFLQPRDSDRARLALARATGEPTFEILIAFLAFVRTAHYWTETHPTLRYEVDVEAMLQAQPRLARLVLGTAEADQADSGRAVRQALEDLRRTSGALNSSEKRFHALVTATSDVLFCVSPDWREMRSLEGKGYLADLPAPDTAWLQRYIPRDDHEKFAAAIERSLATKTMFELEHRVIRRDGSVGVVLSRAVPIFDLDGGIVDWFGGSVDLTARKNAEEAIRNADRRKEQFLATLAYELRNPLAPLRNGLEIAKLQASANPQFVETIAIMDRQLKRLTHLVDDILDVSRISSGKIHLRRAPVSVEKVLAGSAEGSRALIDARKHTLAIELLDDDLMVDGDFNRLIQVFSNLLSNSAKYTEDAGTIHVQARREDDEAVVTIVDNGIGIPAEDITQIFEIFSQVRSHQARADGGLGIGLSLVRQLVEAHNGSVHAASRGSGLGSTFTVRLPLTIAAASIVAIDRAAHLDGTPSSPHRPTTKPGAASER